MSEAQKRAKKKYQKNITRLTIDFYPTEKELVEQVEKQPKKQTYIKNLIRADILKDMLFPYDGIVVELDNDGNVDKIKPHQKD